MTFIPPMPPRLPAPPAPLVQAEEQAVISNFIQVNKDHQIAYLTAQVQQLIAQGHGHIRDNLVLINHNQHLQGVISQTQGTLLAERNTWAQHEQALLAQVAAGRQQVMALSAQIAQLAGENQSLRQENAALSHQIAQYPPIGSSFPR